MASVKSVLESRCRQIQNNGIVEDCCWKQGRQIKQQWFPCTFASQYRHIEVVKVLLETAGQRDNQATLVRFLFTKPGRKCKAERITSDSRSTSHSNLESKNELNIMKTTLENTTHTPLTLPHLLIYYTGSIGRSVVRPAIDFDTPTTTTRQHNTPNNNINNETTKNTTKNTTTLAVTQANRRRWAR